MCVCQLSPGMLLDRRSVLRVAVGVGWGGHCHLMGCLLPAIEGRGNRVLLCPCPVCMQHACKIWRCVPTGGG